MPRSNAARPGDADYGAPSATRQGLAREKRQEAREKKRRAEARADRRQASSSSSRFDESKVKRGTGAKGGQFVSKGASGEDVANVQRALGVTGEETGGEGRAPTFGPNTAATVIAFQRRHGLEPDGVIGRQTMLALAGQYDRARSVGPGAMGSYTRGLLKGSKARQARRERRDRGDGRRDDRRSRSR